MKLGEITMDSVGSHEILSHISPLMLFTHSKLKWSKSASSCLPSASAGLIKFMLFSYRSMSDYCKTHKTEKFLSHNIDNFTSTRLKRFLFNIANIATLPILTYWSKYESQHLSGTILFYGKIFKRRACSYSFVILVIKRLLFHCFSKEDAI